MLKKENASFRGSPFGENDFALNPNEGYMLYHNGEATTAALPGRFTMAQGNLATATSQDAGTYSTKAMSLGREASVWNFDGSRFANTMAIIGQLEMNDDASDYTIGAFVGDECRGEGKVVNGTAYISVVGEAGETVSINASADATYAIYNAAGALLAKGNGNQIATASLATGIYIISVNDNGTTRAARLVIK